jgi:signal transduction histidine kinase/HAMP domain-containing protein
VTVGATGSDPARPDNRADGRPDGRTTTPAYRRSRLGFRARLTFALIVAAVVPLAAFGALILFVTGTLQDETSLGRLLLLGVAISVIFGMLLAAILYAQLGTPLRAIASAVERVSSGDLATRLDVTGDDDLGRLAESHNRLASDIALRNRELRLVLEGLESITLGERPEAIARQAAARARMTFGMIDCDLLLGDTPDVPEEEAVPGEARQVRADLRAGGERIGVAVGHVPATRLWERADEDLFELFVIEVAAAIRNAQLYARVEDQNARLVALGEAKDEFLRGVSHNLQTPLASIRGYAQQLAAEAPDRRLGIITEQADRLSRLVRQLLAVSRIESGALRPRLEVFSAAARVRRTWEALGAADVPFTIDDRSEGWLALADPDQLDQVLWAILDNAVGYGGRTPVAASITVDPADGDLSITITDHGHGVAAADRERLFGRFERGSHRPSGEGSGLGLYVSRELCRSMGSDLVLEPQQPGVGATLTVHLPAERPVES